MTETARRRSLAGKTAGLICLVLALFGYFTTLTAARTRPLPVDWLERFGALGGELFVPTALLLIAAFLLLQSGRRTAA